MFLFKKSPKKMVLGEMKDRIQITVCCITKLQNVKGLP
jgi:hypothetical protein